MRGAVLPTALLLTGCSGSIEVDKPTREGLMKDVMDEMRIVIPHVKPKHLKQCKDMLEAPKFLSASYRVVGQFAPSIQHSCATQNRGNIAGWRPDTRQVAFVAMVEITSIAGKPWTEPRGVCTFSMRSQGSREITVSLGPDKANVTNACHRL
jgi:hypothetical protein